MLFVCYPKCTTCKKAQKWLDDHGVTYEVRNIKDNNPTKDELTDWHTKSKLPIKRFWNTSGQLYRELGLSSKVGGMTEEEQITLLATDGMLVKRPILIGSDFVLMGFKESEWEQKLVL
ncbi:Regulatory protein MgsR [bioreactor metagenome]|uniref:Regulatory protein MgsR n=1 Tax=bioreactor metagenome TaxID=1076179 RepID=A0A644WLG9_9ZZZZ